ncbi:hypothetical protein PR048_018653, partial [Dryococelus australis]
MKWQPLQFIVSIGSIQYKENKMLMKMLVFPMMKTKNVILKVQLLRIIIQFDQQHLQSSANCFIVSE